MLFVAKLHSFQTNVAISQHIASFCFLEICWWSLIVEEDQFSQLVPKWGLINILVNKFGPVLHVHKSSTEDWQSIAKLAKESWQVINFKPKLLIKVMFLGCVEDHFCNKSAWMCCFFFKTDGLEHFFLNFCNIVKSEQSRQKNKNETSRHFFWSADISSKTFKQKCELFFPTFFLVPHSPIRYL